jgi:predicted RNA binding protein YcfA (HicA-like mRNA interferase family)
MKRIDPIRHLEQHGCEFLRQGSNHTMYVNRKARRSSAVPRQREVTIFSHEKSETTSWFPGPRLHDTGTHED